MVTFLDQNQRRYGVRMTYDIKQSVNGERSLSGKISEPQNVLRRIDRGWRLLVGDEYYVVTYIKPHDKGRQLEVEFDAVHQFFWDFSKSSVHTSLNDGSHTFEEYLHFIFDGSGYSFRSEVKRYAFEKQSFGYKNRLSLFNDVVKQAGVEFVVHGRVVRILDRSGSDLTTVVRKNFNMNELKIEKNVKEFATFQAGFGAWNDKDDHSKGRLSITYRSPLADEYGVIETDPVVDERYTDRESLLNKLKSNVDSSYEISVQIDMEDLTKAGYPYTQPRCGDYIMAINDVLEFRRRVRIISFTSSYDIRGRLISHKITCGSISAVEKSVTQVSALSAKIGQAQIETAEAYKAALEALVATNGKNKNYWGNTFPTDDPPGTLIKGDQLYYQNGEKTELYVWNGLEWQKAKLGIDEEELEKEIAEVEKQLAEQEKLHNTKVADLLTKAGLAQSTGDEAKRLAEKANADLTKERERSNSAIQGALSEARRLDQEERKATERAIQEARAGAVTEATNLVNVAKRALEVDLSGANRLILETKRTLESQVSGVSTELTKTNDTIKTLAKKTDVDRVNQRLSTAETSITQQANQIALKANQQAVDGLAGRVRNAESSITQQGEQIALKANKSDVDSVKNRVFQAEASLQVQAGQIAVKANKLDVDNLSGKVSQAEASLRVQAGEIAKSVKAADFDKEKEKLRTAETNIRQLGERITTEISRTEAKIPRQVGSRNFVKDSEEKVYRIANSGLEDLRFFIVDDFWKNNRRLQTDMVRVSFDIKFEPALPRGVNTNVHFSATPWYNPGGVLFRGGTTKLQHFDLLFDLSRANEDYYTDNVFIRLGGDLFPTGTVATVERFTLHLSEMIEVWEPAFEDTESEIESVKTTITNTAEGVEQLSTRITQAEGKSSRQETKINQLIGDVSSKVSQTDYDNLKRTVDGHTTEMRQTKESINLKADKTLVTTVQTTATEAKNLANSTNSKSDSATAKANQADSKATSANAKAEQASTKADSAVSTANQANQKATSADSKASNAATKAEDAARKSAEAMTKSVDALSKAGLVDVKATEALAKAIQNSQSISRAQAELQVANEAINTKVSKVDFDLANRKLATAETQINTIAGQISTNLSRTEVVQTIESKGYQTASQVDSLVQAKGYQTAGQVEAAITSKGYVTTSTFSNTIQQTERGLVSRIAQVETKIPDGYSGANLILEGARQTTGQYWENSTLLKHGFYHNSEKYLFQLNTNKSEATWTSSNRFKVKRNTKYSLSFWTFSSGNMKYFDVYFLGRKKGETKDWTSANRFIRERGPSPHRAEYVTATFDSGDNDEGLIRLFNGGSKDGQNAIFAFGEVMLVEGNTPARYSPSPDELATTIALHEVRDTVDSHTRTLTAQGRSISQAVQTAEGIVSRVANTEGGVARLDGRANFVENALNATKNEVSQLAGSWAVRNLTDSGTVLNQLNLNRDGSVKIDGSLVQITGRTYIQDGVISSAKIGQLDAGKITSGTLDAYRVTIVNMDASNIVTGQMSANRIRGGTISSLNDRSQINLQNGRFYVSDNEAGFFRVDSQASTMGLKFINSDEQIAGTQRKVSRVILGGDRRQEGSDSNFGWDKGGFTGIVISTVKGALSADSWQVDDVQVIGDRVVFSHSYYADKNATNLPQQGWEMYNYVSNSPRGGSVLFRPYMIDKNQSAIETGNLYLYPRKDRSVNLLEVLRELKIGFVHIKNAGFSDAARNAIISSINKLSSLGI